MAESEIESDGSKIIVVVMSCDLQRFLETLSRGIDVFVYRSQEIGKWVVTF